MEGLHQQVAFRLVSAPLHRLCAFLSSSHKYLVHMFFAPNFVVFRNDRGILAKDGRDERHRSTSQNEDADLRL